MTFHHTGFSNQPPHDEWHEWYNTLNQRYPSSHIDPNAFEGLAAISPETRWYPGTVPQDTGCTWMTQYPTIMDACTSSPSSEWPSCQTLPASSTWTSPLQSPESANDFLHTTSSASFTATHGLPALAFAEYSSIHYLNPQNEFAYSAAQQHTPRPQDQSQMIALPGRPPASSGPLSPSIMSQAATLPIMYRQAGKDNNLHGLGLMSISDPSQSQAIEQEEPVRTTQLKVKRPRKRRKLGKDHPPPPPRPKQFPCKHCHFAFDRKSNLTTHLKIHGITKEKMIKCSEPGCQKSYGRRSDANRHARSAHQGEYFPCDSCAKVFGRHDLRMRHIQQGCMGRQ